MNPVNILSGDGIYFRFNAHDNISKSLTGAIVIGQLLERMSRWQDPQLGLQHFCKHFCHCIDSNAVEGETNDENLKPLLSPFITLLISLLGEISKDNELAECYELLFLLLHYFDDESFKALQNNAIPFLKASSHMPHYQQQFALHIAECYRQHEPVNSMHCLAKARQITAMIGQNEGCFGANERG